MMSYLDNRKKKILYTGMTPLISSKMVRNLALMDLQSDLHSGISHLHLDLYFVNTNQNVTRRHNVTPVVASADHLNWIYNQNFQDSIGFMLSRFSSTCRPANMPVFSHIVPGMKIDIDQVLPSYCLPGRFYEAMTLPTSFYGHQSCKVTT